MRKRTIAGITGAGLIGLGALLYNPIHDYYVRKQVENGVLNADLGTSSVVTESPLTQKRELLKQLEEVHTRIVGDSLVEKVTKAQRLRLKDSLYYEWARQLNRREGLANILGIPIDSAYFLRNGFVDTAIANLAQELGSSEEGGLNISDYSSPTLSELPVGITPKIKSDVKDATPQSVVSNVIPERKTKGRITAQPTKLSWKYNPSYATFAYEDADGRYDSFTLIRGNTIFGGLEEIANRANAKLGGKDILRLSEDVEVYRKGEKLGTWSPNKLLVGDKVRLTEEVQDAIYGISEECTTENIDTTDSDRLKEEIRLFKEELDARKRAAELIDHDGDNLLPIKPRNALSFNAIVPDYKPGISYERLFDNGLGLGFSIAKFDEGPAVLGRASYGNDRVRMGINAGDTFTDDKKAVTAAPYFQFDIGDKLYLEGCAGINDIGRWKKQLDGNGFDADGKYGFLSLGIGKKF